MDETVKAQIDFLKDSLKIMNGTNYDSLRKIALDTIDRMEKQLIIQRVDHCACAPVETTGTTSIHCCNICGKPTESFWR